MPAAAATPTLNCSANINTGFVGLVSRSARREARRTRGRTTPPNVSEGLPILAPNDGQSEWFIADNGMEITVSNCYYFSYHYLNTCDSSARIASAFTCGTLCDPVPSAWLATPASQYRQRGIFSLRTEWQPRNQLAGALFQALDRPAQILDRHWTPAGSGHLPGDPRPPARLPPCLPDKA